MRNEELITARKQKKWTQEELASKLDCMKSTISNWENGYSTPTLADAFRVAELLGLPIDTLFRSIKVQVTQTSA